MPTPPQPQSAFWRPAILIALATLAVYAGVFGNDFLVLDDRAWIVDNPRVQEGLTAEGVRWAFTTHFGAAWQPLVWLSWMTDRSLFGDQPAGFHLVNLLLHLTASLLLFSALRRMLGSSGVALLVALLYALHPVQVESVAWAAERKGLLAAAFWMLAVEFHSRYMQRPRVGWAIGVFASMTLGLMAKSTLLTLPFALLLLDFWPGERGKESWGRLLREKLGLFLLLPLFLWVGFQAQAGFGAVRDASGLEQAGSSLVAYARSLGHLFVPLDLGPMYVAPAGGFSAVAVITSVVMLLAVTLTVLRFRRSVPAMWIGWLWFAGTLLPFSGVVAIGGHFMADRYLLIPSVGIWLGLVFLVSSLLDHRSVTLRSRWILGAVVLILLGATSFRQVARWTDSATLFAHTLEIDRDNYLAAYWLGEARALDGDLEGAAASFADARTTNPAYDLAWFKEGSALLELRRNAAAAAAFEEYLRLRPNQFKGWMNLGVAYGRLGRLEEALRCFERAVEISPSDQQALANRDRARQMLSSRERGKDDD
jgi:hypothetical protein